MIYAALAHLFAVMSPGPDTAIVIREVSINKRKGGLSCAFGIGVGILIHCYLAIFGISTLLLTNNIAGDLISMLGSFYLIYIGIASFKSELQTSEKSQLMASSFINGFITNIFNIKAFIFFISLFSIILNEDITYVGKIFIPIYFAIATSLWFSFLTIVLTQDNIQKRWEPVQLIINKISGSILIGLGCLILINILF